MKFDLREIQEFCEAEGLKSAFAGPDELQVRISSEAKLCFVNLIAENDTLIGFEGTPWHCHDSLMVMTSENSSIELTPTDILAACLTGDLLVCTSRIDGSLHDRWLVHREAPQDTRYIESGELLAFERCRITD